MSEPEYPDVFSGTVSLNDLPDTMEHGKNINIKNEKGDTFEILVSRNFVDGKDDKVS